MGDGWGVVMVLGMVGIWSLVAVAIFWMVRSSTTAGLTPRPGRDSTDRTATSNAEEILAERLARGDIDADEYRARIDTLTSRSGY